MRGKGRLQAPAATRRRRPPPATVQLPPAAQVARMKQQPRAGQPAPSFATFLGLSWAVLGLLAVVGILLVCLLSLPAPWAVWALAAQAASLLVPLRVPPPPAVTRFLRFSVRCFRSYFPITIHFEDKDAFKKDRPCIVGEQRPAVSARTVSVAAQLHSPLPALRRWKALRLPLPAASH